MAAYYWGPWVQLPDYHATHAITYGTADPGDGSYGAVHRTASYDAVANFFEHGGIFGDGIHVPWLEPVALSCMWVHVVAGNVGGYGSFGAGPGIMDGCPVIYDPNPNIQNNYSGAFLVGEKEQWSKGFFSSDTMNTEMHQHWINVDTRWLRLMPNPDTWGVLGTGWTLPTGAVGFEWADTLNLGAGTLGYGDLVTVDVDFLEVDNYSNQAYDVEIYAGAANDWYLPGSPAGTPLATVSYPASAGHSTAAESNRLYRGNLAKGQTGLSVAFDLPTQVHNPGTLTEMPDTMSFGFISSRMRGGPPTLVGADHDHGGYNGSVALGYLNFLNLVTRPPLVRFKYPYVPNPDLAAGDPHSLVRYY